MNKILQFLNRKFPVQLTSIKNILLVSIAIGFFIRVMEPLGFINYTGNKVVAAFVFSAITFFCVLISTYIFKKQARKIIKHWSILVEIIYSVFLIILISIFNFIYFSFIIPGFNISINSFLSAIISTILVGIFPISFIAIFRYYKVMKNELGLIVKSGNYEYGKKHKENIITFSSLNKTEKDFLLSENNFLFVEVIKNDLHIYYYDGDKVKTKSIRNTLSNLTKQLNEKFIFRCHRSFVVNLNNIKTAKGNSNGYKIYFKNYNHYVPVSRSYVYDFQKIIY